MEDLIFGISGVRGVVGVTLTEDIAVKLGKSYGSFIISTIKQNNKNCKTIAVGKDLRKSGKKIMSAFINGVIRTGINVVELGNCATPALLMYTGQNNEICGGAVITASHNPKEWNGIKFVNSNGTFLDTEDINCLYKIYNKTQMDTDVDTEVRGIQSISNFQFSQETGTSTKGKVMKDNNCPDFHKKNVLSAINVSNIKAYKFRIVFDSANGVLGKEGKEFLEELGCSVIMEDSERGLEPIKENLSRTAIRVKKEGADAGFAVDPDGDRLSLIDETGVALGEEYTFALVSASILSSRKGIVVTNLSTSRMVDDIACQHKCSVVRTKVGEINVVRKMMELGRKAVLGGEGNGGIIDPTIQYTRDAIVGMARILEYLTSGKKLSELVELIPKYYIRKEKYKTRIYTDVDTEVHGIQSIHFEEYFSKVKIMFPSASFNLEDGIRIDFPEAWIHIRKSNTEPLYRIICEAKFQTQVDNLIEEAKKCVE